MKYIPKKKNTIKLNRYLKKLRKLQSIHDDHWLGEFQDKFTGVNPEAPLPEPEMEPMVNLGCAFAQSINNLVTTGLSQSINFESEISIYSDSTVRDGYASIPLSQEGLLWTLWQLTKPSKSISDSPPQTYFNGFQFGTSTRSKYPIGQMAYFINNKQIGCIPLNSAIPVASGTSVNTLNQINNITRGTEEGNSSGIINTETRDIVNINGALDGVNKSVGLGILPGIQSLNTSLILNTKQLLAILVVKVTEQVARITNDAAGFCEDNWIYVGYDGWSVVRTTMNPIEPMAAQTYVTPQSVTGSVVGDNYQVIFPPNFPQAIFFKNNARIAPTNTVDGLFMGTPFVANPSK